MELKDTVDLMLSDDWKDRLKAEYMQCLIRIGKLQAALRENTMGSWEREVLTQQLHTMCGYCGVLASRVLQNGIAIQVTFDHRRDPVSS